MKNATVLSGVIGAIGAFFSTAMGGWTTGMQTLLIFMGIDYLTGLIVAGVFKNSTKSESGALESRAGWKGLCRKGMTLLIVLISYRLDLMLGTSYIRDAVVITFAVNEALSILENAALMGLPLPAVLVKALDVLKQKASFDEGTENE